MKGALIANLTLLLANYARKAAGKIVRHFHIPIAPWIVEWVKDFDDFIKEWEK